MDDFHNVSELPAMHNILPHTILHPHADTTLSTDLDVEAITGQLQTLEPEVLIQNYAELRKRFHSLTVQYHESVSAWMKEKTRASQLECSVHELQKKVQLQDIQLLEQSLRRDLIVCSTKEWCPAVQNFHHQLFTYQANKNNIPEHIQSSVSCSLKKELSFFLESMEARQDREGKEDDIPVAPSTFAPTAAKDQGECQHTNLLQAHVQKLVGAVHNAMRSLQPRIYGLEAFRTVLQHTFSSWERLAQVLQENDQYRKREQVLLRKCKQLESRLAGFLEQLWKEKVWTLLNQYEMTQMQISQIREDALREENEQLKTTLKRAELYLAAALSLVPPKPPNVPFKNLEDVVKDLASRRVPDTCESEFPPKEAGEEGAVEAQDLCWVRNWLSWFSSVHFGFLARKHEHEILQIESNLAWSIAQSFHARYLLCAMERTPECSESQSSTLSFITDLERNMTKTLETQLQLWQTVARANRTIDFLCECLVRWVARREASAPLLPSRDQEDNPSKDASSLECVLDKLRDEIAHILEDACARHSDSRASPLVVPFVVDPLAHSALSTRCGAQLEQPRMNTRDKLPVLQGTSWLTIVSVPPPNSQIGMAFEEDHHVETTTTATAILPPQEQESGCSSRPPRVEDGHVRKRPRSSDCEEEQDPLGMDQTPPLDTVKRPLCALEKDSCSSKTPPPETVRVGTDFAYPTQSFPEECPDQIHHHLSSENTHLPSQPESDSSSPNDAPVNPLRESNEKEQESSLGGAATGFVSDAMNVPVPVVFTLSSNPEMTGSMEDREGAWKRDVEDPSHATEQDQCSTEKCDSRVLEVCANEGGSELQRTDSQIVVPKEESTTEIETPKKKLAWWTIPLRK